MKRQSGPFMTIIFACAAALAALIAPLAPAQAQGRPIRLVAFGDSLTAGYGLPQEAAFPVVLERALKARGHSVEIANAGVSGDTTSGGLDRLDWSVPDGTDGVILELGANDMLRGLDPAGIRRNLEAIVERLKARNIPVMLAGMYATRNLGPDYIAKFDPIHQEIAKKHDLVLYPFFLDGVAGDRSLNLPDGIHPTAKGIEIIVGRILPTVESFLARIAQR
ncbi:arylesterase [Microvirga arsenatis]|uniref:Arylesterase n=1 Tax=Microvirga arsenatis TaxID=2692265 RepID=A0ABW9YY62_9HYPH|nr:arylesterase [Microvirga arsenatis]NBJ10304.1 arylesterase [Microvirga arsenatis]NBJ24797.1 arylesterase [Microvirga arsenatis]